MPLRNFPRSFNSQSGIAPVLLVLVLALLATVPLLGSQTTFKPADQPMVKGVLITRGDENQSSGEDLRSTGDSNQNEHQNSGSSNLTAKTEVTVTSDKTGEKEKPETHKVEQPETKTENEKETPEASASSELETEIRNEIEKPDVEKVHISTSDGQLEVETETATPGGSKQHLSLKNGKLSLETGQGKNKSKLEVQMNGSQLEFKFDGVGAATAFPLSFDKNTGQLTVSTPQGLKTIQILPNQAAAAAETTGLVTQVENLELVQSSSSASGDAVSFKVSGKRTGALFGLIPVNIDVQTEIGAQSGTVLSVTQPLWLRLLSGLVI